MPAWIWIISFAFSCFALCSFFSKKGSHSSKLFAERYTFPYLSEMTVREPYKTQSKGETECLRALETLFPNSTFHKVRPPWLINPKSGRALELDFYNEKLGLAVEYNGAQHYRYKPTFHKSYADFLAQADRDKTKIEILRKRKIELISVPYSVKNIHKFIMNKCVKKLI